MTERSDDVLAARLLPGGGTVKAPGVVYSAILLEGTAIVWALAGAADVAAILVVRRSRAARWVLAGCPRSQGFSGWRGSPTSFPWRHRGCRRGGGTALHTDLTGLVPDRSWMTGTR